MNESVRIRRGYPLVPKAITVREGVVLVARANWDRVEVRDECGALVFAHEIAPEGDWVLHGMRLAGRWLVCAIGSGIMTCGFRVWDLSGARVTFEVVETWLDGPQVLWASPDGPHFLVAAPTGMEIWNADTLQRERAIELAAEPICGACSPVDERLLWGEQHATICDHDGTSIVTMHRDAEIDEVGWSGDARWVAIRPASRHVEICDAETARVALHTSSTTILAASECGRWLALDRELVDLRDRAVHPIEHASAAAFDAMRGELVLADVSRTRRIPLP